jgi:hypothetical protein
MLTYDMINSESIKINSESIKINSESINLENLRAIKGYSRMTTYAVLFKTHFWDSFTSRQLDRLKRRIGRSQIYVLIDETLQPAPPIGHDKIICVTSAGLSALKLAPITTHGSILWYNVDYPHYIAFSKLQPFDYYVTLEYDTIVNIDLDELVDRLEAGGTDFLAFPRRTAASEWPWYSMHLDIYGADMLTYLSCFSVFSRRALEMLLARRQAMSDDFSAEKLSFWPMSEAFLPNEIRNAGMRIATLDCYGNTDAYDWFPPFEEGELPGLASRTFIHPVLPGKRYVRSLIHHEPSFANFFRSNSTLRRKLAGFDPAMVRPMLRSAFIGRLRGWFRRKLENIGLRPKWYANALSRSARSVQGHSTHNCE